MSNETASTTKSSGLLKWVEQLGNKLPHPFWMFVWITIMIIATSAVAALFGLSATDPGTGEEVFAENLVSGEGLRRFLEEMVTNFAHFAPFGLVLVMLMGVSVAERSGLLTIVLRTMAFAVPRRVVLPFIFIIGACGNIGSDAGVVIVPPHCRSNFHANGTASHCRLNCRLCRRHSRFYRQLFHCRNRCAVGGNFYGGGIRN